MLNYLKDKIEKIYETKILIIERRCSQIGSMKKIYKGYCNKNEIDKTTSELNTSLNSNYLGK